MISVKATGSDLHVNGLNVVPAGSIICYSGENVPQGWLFCNGQAISRTTYHKLFNTIGTIYGTGNGTTTFNLPNLQDRFPMGKGTSSLGVTGGSDTITLTSDKIPSHSHTASLGSAGEHSHTATTDTNGSHTHSYTDAYFAEHSGPDNHFGTSANTDSNNDYYFRDNSGTGAAGDHSHTLTTTTAPSHTHTVTIDNTGTSNPTIDITNKYITLNYIIRF